MKKNEDLQTDVQDAINWEPLLKAAEIRVTAKDGVITLTGIVDSLAKKSEAEDAAKNVNGVKEVVDEIEIRFGPDERKGDNEISYEVLNALKWNLQVPRDKVHVKVEAGWVILEGELTWNYQKEAAKKTVCNLACVKGVINNISIISETKDQVEEKGIEKALARNWSIKDQDIHVSVSESKVTLNGIVHSLYQKNEAGRIAWNAPGVCDVNNELVIGFMD